MHEGICLWRPCLVLSSSLHAAAAEAVVVVVVTTACQPHGGHSCGGGQKVRGSPVSLRYLEAHRSLCHSVFSPFLSLTHWLACSLARFAFYLAEERSGARSRNAVSSKLKPSFDLYPSATKKKTQQKKRQKKLEFTLRRQTDLGAGEPDSDEFLP